ncbi:MAG: DUF86 domain-containing protein [Desulfobacteraceae bacterium]|nr:DUF86 domain-containing protein [Desulfobacteraceae bacterium]
MRKDDAVRLKHMLDASREVISFAKGKNRSDLDTDRKLALALVKSIEIIGEAASKISAEGRDSHSHIPWASIISMRNRLIHAYYEIDLDILWKTVIEDIPPLLKELEQINPSC